MTAITPFVFDLATDEGRRAFDCWAPMPARWGRPLKPTWSVHADRYGVELAIGAEMLQVPWSTLRHLVRRQP